MCNDYEQHVSWAAYRKAMQQLDLGVPTGQDESDLPQADDIRVNDTGPVMRVAGNGVELVPMTFGFTPQFKLLIVGNHMAEPDTMVRIGVGRDAADVAFLIVYGESELKKQKVAVKRK